MTRERERRPSVRKHGRNRAAALAIPRPVIVAVVYVAVFRILSLFMLCQTFDEHAESWLRPGVWGASPLGLAKAVNLLFIVWLGISAAGTTNGPRGGRRSRWAVYASAILVLALLQYGISRNGDLAWHTYHLRHATDSRTPPLERAGHFTRAIALFPRVALSERAYLGRANAHRLAGEYERAVECYRENIRLVKEGVYDTRCMSATRCGLSLALWALGDRGGAEEELVTATGHGFMGPHDLESYADHENPVIASLLAHPDSGVPLLGEIEATDSVPGLVRLHVAGGSLYGTLRAFGDIGDRRAVPAIMRTVAAYAAPCDWSNAKPAEALGEIGDLRAVPCLLRIIDRCGHGTRCALAAHHALRRILERDPLMPPPSRRMGALWCGYGFPDAEERRRLRGLTDKYLDEHPADRERWDAMLDAARSWREGFRKEGE